MYSQFQVTVHHQSSLIMRPDFSSWSTFFFASSLSIFWVYSMILATVSLMLLPIGREPQMYSLDRYEATI